uniref:DUF4216 domain-containing protein n=1 Tax=Nelumbo nucifera TaxID=4432 RepID=A0A822XSI1_NELNU|nr:TPA_asm: hypothetical protein HUJ06_024750 [Nelumbo nucifera]
MGEREEDEPFVLANQVQQVFYVEDDLNKGWHIMNNTKPCELYDVGLVKTEGDVAYMDGAPIFSIMENENIHINDESIEWIRDDIASDVVEKIFNIAQSRTLQQLDGQLINDSLEEDVSDESTSDTDSYTSLSDDSD